MNKKTLSSHEKRLALVLLSPVIMLLSVFILYPFSMVLYYSFTDDIFASSEKSHFVGLENYQKLLSFTIKEVPLKKNEQGNIEKGENGENKYVSTIKVLPKEPYRYKKWKTFNFFKKKYVIGVRDNLFYQAVSSTVVYSIFSVLLETILGLAIAVALNREFRGRGIARATILIPWAIPTAVASKMWQWMFNASRVGFFNTILSELGFSDGQTSFLSTPSLQLPIMIFIDVWKTTPFMILLLMAGLQTIPNGLYEAARIDGASKIKQFGYITIPMLLPVIGVSLIFRTLDTLRVFDLFQIIYGQTRYSVSSFIYYQLIYSKQTGYSSASGVLLFIILMGITIFYMKTIMRKGNEI